MVRITATPGRFCDAMVTMNSGSAMLTKALKVNAGMVNTGRASSSCRSSLRSSPWPRAKAMPTSKVTMTA